MNTVQEVFKKNYQEYADTNKLSDQQQKVAYNVLNCHTEAMGANVRFCEECGHIETHYNSCRNRHCPSCQGINKDVWADARMEDTINAPYFHVVFTVPEQLKMIIYQNKEVTYNLLYKATAETIFELSNNKKYLGAKPGFFSVLHTWTQDLRYHPHIHTVLIGGGLTKIKHWRSSGKKFFLPVKVLAKLFRGKFLAVLKSLYNDGKLDFYSSISELNDVNAFNMLLSEVYKIDWYTYIKDTFSGSSDVVEYLARYTHRVAISNNRIVRVGENTVTFKVRDRKATGELKQVTLDCHEFIRRFLMHVLPKGFVKIRYYGILASRNKKTLLVLCIKLTNTIEHKSKLKNLNKVEILFVLYKIDINLCPCCKIGKLIPLSARCNSS